MNPYGFDWGPMTVERVAHIEGRGYVVVVRPTDSWEPSVQVYVSEKGRSVRVYTRGKVRIHQAENPAPAAALSVKADG